MRITVLLAGRDDRYIKRLAEILRKTLPKTGDTLDIVALQNNEDIVTFLAEGNKQRKDHYCVPVTCGDIRIAFGGVPFAVQLSEDEAADGVIYTSEHNENIMQLYKYQPVSRIAAKIIELSKNKKITANSIVKTKKTTITAFFSPQGGAGVSTLAAAYSAAIGKTGVSPLFVSLEAFNSSELFFRNSPSAANGLDEIFRAITRGGNIHAAFESVKNVDKNVTVIGKFKSWQTAEQLNTGDIYAFIEAVRKLADINELILDMGYARSPVLTKVFDCADTVFIITDNKSVSHMKLGMLLEDGSFINKYGGKLRLIYNKVGENGIVKSFGIKNVLRIPEINKSPSEMADAVIIEFLRIGIV